MTFVNGQVLTAEQLNTLRADLEQNTTDQLQALIPTLLGMIGDGAFRKGNAPNLDTLTDVVDVGAYNYTSSATGRPSSSGGAVILLSVGSGANSVQVAYTDTTPVQVYTRRWSGSSWSAWAALSTPDTGLRNINDLIPDRASGELRIRRRGDTVHVVIDRVALDDFTNGTFASLPLGFRPEHRIFKEAARYYVPDVATGLMLSLSGQLVIPAGRSVSPGDTFNASFTYLTNNTWPSTLPGTPA